METDSEPSVPEEVEAAFMLRPVRFLGGRANKHWLVESSGDLFALRAYCAEQAASADFEHAVLRHLYAKGWPVPLPVKDHIASDGRRWAVFTYLPGAHPPKERDDRRARGRLLAQLHADLATLPATAQRHGSQRADAVVADPELHAALAAYASIDAGVAHLLQWHAAVARDSFAALPLDDSPLLALHGDFVSWNLLFNAAGKLSGIVDFEATHLNFRVSDFALSWRGEQDEVIDGYNEVHALNDLDRALIVPAYWSWLLLGAKKQARIDAADGRPGRFQWQVNHFLRRSSRYDNAPRYPGG